MPPTVIVLLELFYRPFFGLCFFSLAEAETNGVIWLRIFWFPTAPPLIEPLCGSMSTYPLHGGGFHVCGFSRIIRLFLC